jgi:hypothetical protein
MIICTFHHTFDIYLFYPRTRLFLFLRLQSSTLICKCSLLSSSHCRSYSLWTPPAIPPLPAPTLLHLSLASSKSLSPPIKLSTTSLTLALFPSTIPLNARYSWSAWRVAWLDCSIWVVTSFLMVLFWAWGYFFGVGSRWVGSWWVGSRWAGMWGSEGKRWS